MVKKLIGNLLNKKEGKDEEVPDELPPLVEDEIEDTPEEVLEKVEEKLESPKEVQKTADSSEAEAKAPTEAASEAPAEGAPTDFSDLENNEVPDEIPSLDEKPEEKLAQAAVESSEKAVAKEGKPVETKPLPEHIKPLNPVESHEVNANDEIGFFNEIITLAKNQGLTESILKQDLITRMKDFWYFHPAQQGRLTTKDRLDQEVMDELSALKNLEERWIAQRKFLEEDKRILLEKEREIKARAEKLQKAMGQLKIYNNAPVDKFFNLSNGMQLKNIAELMKLLDIVDDSTYANHVHNGKNDFANWVKDAFGNEDLAKKLLMAKTREEMAVILENAAMGNMYIIEPNQYFRMGNGKIARDIRELIHIIEESDDGTFFTHINSQRNDFSSWIRNVFKNDYLADKLQMASDKKSVLEVLEEFSLRN